MAFCSLHTLRQARDGLQPKQASDTPQVVVNSLS
jgi:hypothetical protein